MPSSCSQRSYITYRYLRAKQRKKHKISVLVLRNKVRQTNNVKKESGYKSVKDKVTGLATSNNSITFSYLISLGGAKQ